MQKFNLKHNKIVEISQLPFFFLLYRVCENLSKIYLFVSNSLQKKKAETHYSDMSPQKASGVQVLQSVEEALVCTGQRTIIVTHDEKTFFRTVVDAEFGSACVCIASKQAAMNVVEEIESCDSPAALKRYASGKSVRPHCVIVEPKMRTRNMQKSFHLRKLREKKRLYDIALVEETSDLSLVNRNNDSSVDQILLHCAHPNFESQLTQLKNRFGKANCGGDNALLANTVDDCVADYISEVIKCAFEVEHDWLLIRIDSVPLKVQCAVFRTPPTVSEAAASSDDANCANKSKIALKSTAGAPAAKEKDSEHGEDDSEDSEDSEDDESEETKIQRHIEIIDRYIEKIQKKHAKKSDEKAATNSNGSGWFWWLPTWK